MYSSGKASARTLVGICAYNEEHNIGKLLQNLLTKQDLPTNSEILVICSGCTDRTPHIVREFSNKDARIELVIENTRKGKANALNKIFKRAKESADILVLVNADALPGHGSIEKLIFQLKKKRGVVFARPVPLNGMQSISNRIVHIVWELHHTISLYKGPKLSAELCAIRSKCLENIPENIATDEPYIELFIRKQGYQVSYVPEAIVYIRCPTNMLDLLRQRIRIWTGHLQIQKRTGFAVSTSNFKNVLWTVSTLKLRDIPYALLGALLEGLAYLVARLNFSVGKVLYAWEPIKSTKTSI
jgi:cellulose synthase/poly-beta-1,6-N-acetylglucosamine synthase-like glycosyltransferase